MKAKKIVNVIVDFILIVVVFSITDHLMLKVLQSENLWLELGIYLVLYGIVFGAKSGIMYLWNRNNKRTAKAEGKDL